jgi:hypothetical protein
MNLELKCRIIEGLNAIMYIDEGDNFVKKYNIEVEKGHSQIKKQHYTIANYLYNLIMKL